MKGKSLQLVPWGQNQGFIKQNMGEIQQMFEMTYTFPLLSPSLLSKVLLSFMKT